jgi:hypothetical protein
MGAATKQPTPLGTAGGPTTPSGVWENADSIELINNKGFLAHFTTTDGIQGVIGNYTSYECLSDSSYIAANAQVISYANGTSTKAYNCEKGVRDGDTLTLTFSNGPDCKALESSTAAPDATYTLSQAAPGVDIKCGAAVPAPGPPRPAADNPLDTVAPTPLANPGGPLTPTGVWEDEGSSMEIIIPKGFVAKIMTSDGMDSINGRYLSYQCVDANSYIAVNEQIRTYADGTFVKGYNCEKGVRDGDTLKLTFSSGPDCSALESSDAEPSVTYTLAYALPDTNIECGTAEPGRSPGVVPPVSSAARVALTGAMAAVAVALFL